MSFFTLFEKIPTVVGQAIVTGAIKVFPEVPLPNCPFIFEPQSHKSPKLLMAALWLLPADIIFQLLPFISVGIVLSNLVLSPN